MGILDRLSRLARAEANHLGERVREAISGVSGSDRPNADEEFEAPEPEPRPERAKANNRSTGPSTETGSTSTSRWPRDVRDSYATLSLPLGASRTEARAAYKRLLHAHHPDKHQDDGEAERRATERTMKIRAAWERLDTFLPKD
jgi:DnaJ-domain-containing protein 1